MCRVFIFYDLKVNADLVMLAHRVEQIYGNLDRVRPRSVRPVKNREITRLPDVVSPKVHNFPSIF
jgi:hypothetical protein